MFILLETPSPDDLEDTSDKVVVLGEDVMNEGGDGDEEPQHHLEVDNVERIFVPEHKNQATSPSHPMAQQQQQQQPHVMQQAASDAEVGRKCAIGCRGRSPTSPISCPSTPICSWSFPLCSFLFLLDPLIY